MVEENNELPYYAEDDEIRAWRKAVREHYRHRCGNCGHTDRLREKMVVPISAGGKPIVSNGVLLCRSCEMASEAPAKRASNNQRLINFWASQSLHDRVRKGLDTHKSFASLGALVRYLVSKYIQDETRFDDLELFQDEESSDVKINIWVDKDHYAVFRTLLDKRGMTVTDAIKGLILFYEMNQDTAHGKELEIES